MTFDTICYVLQLDDFFNTSFSLDRHRRVVLFGTIGIENLFDLSIFSLLLL